MINEEYKAMLGGKSVIRELSEYATSRGAEIGYQNVFDYSLGNPSVPAPKSFADAMIDADDDFRNGCSFHGKPQIMARPKFVQRFSHGIFQLINRIVVLLKSTQCRGETFFF